MTIYCDSSSLLKLYIEEDQSEKIERLVEGATSVATSAIAFVEIRSALARSLRERRLTRPAFDLARHRLSDDWAALVTISPDFDLLRSAADLAERHALRALDSIHLASFQQVLERTDDDVEFSSFDDRLIRAAKKLR